MPFRLLKKFDHENYEKITNKLDDPQYINFYKITSDNFPESFNFERWEKDPTFIDENSLYFLIESYYRIPWRPDLSFVNVWQAINIEFYSLYLKNPSLPTNKSIQEYLPINYFLEMFYQLKLSDNKIKELELGYINALPEKLFMFCADKILEGIKDEESSIPKYKIDKSFKHYKEINGGKLVAAIKETFYFKYNQPGESHRNIKIAIAKKLKQLLMGEKVEFKNSHNDHKIEVHFEDKDVTTFLFKCTLYVHRNNLIHGNKKPRLASLENFKDFKIYYKESASIYFLAHFYLSFLFVLNNKLTLDEVDANAANLEKLNKILKEFYVVSPYAA